MTNNNYLKIQERMAKARDAKAAVTRITERNDMAIPFCFHKESILESTIDDENTILIDDEGILVGGGYFVDPSEYPDNYEKLLSFKEFKEKALTSPDGDKLEVIVRGKFNSVYCRDMAI